MPLERTKGRGGVGTFESIESVEERVARRGISEGECSKADLRLRCRRHCSTGHDSEDLCAETHAKVRDFMPKRLGYECAGRWQPGSDRIVIRARGSAEYDKSIEVVECFRYGGPRVRSNHSEFGTRFNEYGAKTLGPGIVLMLHDEYLCS